MNLTISQDNSRTETINSSIIDKLYEIAFAASSDPNSTVSLTGRLESPKGYKYKIDWLNTNFSPDLTITVPTSGLYIYFEDDAVLSALVSAGISSDGTGISADDLLVPTNLSQLGLSGNSNISSFTELSKFVNIRNNSTNFNGCTNLEWISLPNNDGNLNVSFSISGGKKLKWVVPSVEFACSKEFNSWHNNPARGGGADTAWLLYDLNKQPITDVVIPEGTTTIGKYVFSKMSCNSISIPSSITSISWGAFENTHTVQPFTLNSLEVTTIERDSFIGSTLSEINIPNLTNLAIRVFRDNSTLLSVISLGKISNIPSESFAVCNGLTSVIIPYECTNIADNAFINCTSLTTIKLYTQSVNDWTEGTTPSSTNIGRVTVFGLGCLRGCLLLTLTNADITNAISIGQTAFFDCKNLTGAITLPNLTSLGNGAFSGCSRITSVDFTGSTITSIPYNCFAGCTSLTSFTGFSNLGSITEIGERAFDNTNISSITIPNSVKKCGCNIVNNTIVPEIIFPEGVEEIIGGLFYTKNNSLTYIEIPSTVTNMGLFFHRSLETSRDNLCTVVIKATTPPELNYYSNNLSLIDSTRGDKFAGIYVPDSSLTAYQNGANAWLHSSIQAKLKPISQLLTDNPTAWAKYNTTSSV